MLKRYENVKPFNAYSVLVTEDCNLACKYCYEVNSSGGHNKNKMTKEVADKTLDFMFSEANKDRDNKNINICFFGGEPTLSMDIIDYMCSEGLKLSELYKKNLTFSIITNATNMNEKIYNIFKKYMKYFEGCQLSVDGPHEIQDSYRVTKSGKGTFKRIESNLIYWKNLFGDKLSVHGCLNKDSVGKLFDSYKYFRENWNVSRLWFIPVKDPEFTKEDVKIYERELYKIYDYIMNVVKKENDLQELSNYAPLDRATRDGKMIKPCGAGDNYCTITAKGDIYPCHHMYYIDENKDTKLGSIYDGVDLSKKHIWSDYDASDLKGCEDCEHPACYRCIAENYEKYLTPFTQIKGLHCDFMMVDYKLQQKIKKEIIEMGLLNKTENEGDCLGNVRGNDCNGLIRDCVGKQGECEKVVSIDECIFDRSDCTCFNRPEEIPDFDEIKTDVDVKEVEVQKQSCCCDNDCCEEKSETNNELKDLVDGIIKSLVKFHNSL